MKKLTNKGKLNNIKRITASILSLAFIFTIIPEIQSSAAEDKYQYVNVLLGKIPTTNANTANNLAAATDGNTYDSNANEGGNLTILEDTRNIEPSPNGIGKDIPQGNIDLYLQYDLEEIRDIKSVKIYRNTWNNGTISKFRNIKVEISNTEDFTDAINISEVDTITETSATTGQPQIITLQNTQSARYIRVTGAGADIWTPGGWKGAYSKQCRFCEIEVYAEKKSVEVNVNAQNTPITNSTDLITVSDLSTVPKVTIQNPSMATNTEINGAELIDNNTAHLAAPAETTSYSDKKDVYLQYDFGKAYPITKVKIYRNMLENSLLAKFKDVKVELSKTEDFANSTVIFEKSDVIEDISGAEQAIILDAPVDARYIRVWQAGYEYNRDGATVYNPKNEYNEIEVISTLDEGSIKPPIPEDKSVNIALNKIPYFYGLEPTNPEYITDGKADENYAVHNSIGKRWLAFDFKNTYKINRICFKLEPGTYKSIDIRIANSGSNSINSGKSVFSATNYVQGDDMKVIKLDTPVNGASVKFIVSKSDNEPTKYSEVEIWATGDNYDESAPEYTPYDTKYTELVWSDEFNGEAIDETKWTIIDGFVNHAAIYNRDAVSIKKDGDNSYLAINSKNYNTKQALVDAIGHSGVSYNNGTIDDIVTWSSGRIESKNKFSFQNGRVLVRAKPNDSKGIWPAIWMLAQDETGHDEIDILEYLGQEPYGAWTTNHFGIFKQGGNKGSSGISTNNYEAWSQNFHVFEVEWDPEYIKFYIDGKLVFTTTAAKDDGRDGMHNRPFFTILETQVGAGWVGPVDYNKQETKQDSDYLIDWVRIYQKPDATVTRFDDLAALENGEVSDYFITPIKATEGLMLLKDGEEYYEDLENFFYGGQPRIENSRVAVKENAQGQSLIYQIPNVRDVHLTAYYRSTDKLVWNTEGWWEGANIRGFLNDGGNIDFKIYTSSDGEAWTLFKNTKVFECGTEPTFVRTTIDAYGLPENSHFVKIEFPDYAGKTYRGKTEAQKAILNTDIQLGKVTFQQERTETDVTKVTLSKDSALLDVNETVELTATVTPEYALNKKIIWTSSDDSIATVKDGVVTGVNAGNAVITATSAENETISATCTITVSEGETDSFLTTFVIEGQENILVHTKQGRDIVMPSNPVKEGYLFGGWYTDAIDGEKVTEFTLEQVVYARFYVDKADLRNEISRAEGDLADQSIYRQSSYNAALEAYLKALRVNEDTNVTQPQIDEVANKLKVALDGLLLLEQQISQESIIPEATSEMPHTTSGDGSAQNAFDGNTNTWWHTHYGSAGDGILPHSITADLGENKLLSKYEYVPRQGSAAGNGTITSYVLEVLEEGVTKSNEWIEVARGTWKEDTSTKTIHLHGVKGRYVRLTALAGKAGFASATEIKIYDVTDEEIVIDKTKLNDAILQADNKLEKHYTKDSWTIFVGALINAKMVSENAAATNIDISKALVNLEIGAKNLKLNTENIRKLIAELKKLDNKNYTVSSYTALMNRVAEIEAIGIDSMSVEELKSYENELVELKSQLVVRGDKEELSSYINSIEKVDLSKYTTDSVARYNNALDELKAVLNNIEDKSEVEVETAKKNFEDAKAALEIKKEPVNPGDDKNNNNGNNDNSNSNNFNNDNGHNDSHSNSNNNSNTNNEDKLPKAGGRNSANTLILGIVFLLGGGAFLHIKKKEV